MSGEIFISYRRADQAKARLLHDLLKQRGVDAWYDALLDAGDDWRDKTAHALVNAPIFVLLFSKAASESSDISKELAAATFQKKTVIPVRIENIDPQGAFLYELASRNWVNAYEDTEAKLAALADRLAELVKGGPKAEAAAKSLGTTAPAVHAPVKRFHWFRPWMAFAAFGMVIGLVAIVGGLIKLGGPAQAENYRTVFFGFTAVDDDPATVTAANIATDEGFRMLELLHVEHVPRTEASGAQDVLARASELGARFALSGEIRREGELLKSTFRLIDVHGRATIAQSGGERPADKLGQVGYMSGALAARLPQCVKSYALNDAGGAPDSEALALMGRVCAADIDNGSTTLLRELMQRRPDNRQAPAQLAESLVFRVPQLPEAQRPAALAEAEEVLKRAEELAPDASYTAIARVSVAVVRQRPPLEWLPRFEEILARAPAPDQAVTYARANAIAGQQLLELGRIQDAARYFSLAVNSDPSAANWEYYEAVARAASGQFGAKDSLDTLAQRRVGGYFWEVALTAAIFFNATDPEIIIAAAPDDVKEAIPCYRDIMASLKATDRQARLAGAKRADECLTAFDSPHVNIQAQSMLGNLDRAFGIADRPDFTKYMWGYWSPLFVPSTKAMRADPRFLPMVERLGFVDYWKQTKTQPDVCGSPEERDIPLCVALRS